MEELCQEHQTQRCVSEYPGEAQCGMSPILSSLSDLDRADMDSGRDDTSAYPNPHRN